MNRILALASSRASPRAAAVARIAVGAAAILKAFERAPVLELLRDPSVARVPYFPGLPTVADLPPELVLIAWVGLALAFMAGLATTWTGIGLGLLLVAVLFGDQQLYSNHLYMLIWLVGLLTLARSGAALSVDALMGRAKASVPAWPLVLLRLQVSVVYLFAGLSKINAVYLSGAVVGVTLRRDGPLAIPGEWRSFEVMAAAAALSVLVELGLSVGLWLPHWRRTAFVVGLGMHAGIAMWFEPTQPLIVFAVIALAPYILFLDLTPRTVVWDDSCDFCRGWVTWFKRLDWLRIIRLVPSSNVTELQKLGIGLEEADRALQLLAPDGHVSGYRAVIGVLEALPVSFLWAPLLRLWPAVWLGDAAYRRVALRRQCAFPR